jgi:biopolymer transport protein ExbD
MNVSPASDKYRIVAEINMIPFIDIALVMLIIFMVMTPFLVRSQIKVDVPEAATAEKTEDEAKSVTVQVDREGGIYIEGQRVTDAGLETTLRRHLYNPKSQSLVVEADKGVSFEHVVTVLDAGKKIGAIHIGVGVKPESAGKSR